MGPASATRERDSPSQTMGGGLGQSSSGGVQAQAMARAPIGTLGCARQRDFALLLPQELFQLAPLRFGLPGLLLRNLAGLTLGIRPALMLRFHLAAAFSLLLRL